METGILLIFVILLVQTAKNDCVNDECTTGIDLSDTFDSTTDNNLSTEQETETEESMRNIENESKLKSSNIKPIVLTVPNNKNSLLKEQSINLINEKQKVESTGEPVSVQGNKTEMTVETTTQLSVNGTSSNTTKEIDWKRHEGTKNRTEICTCDLTVNYCDINCCCDRDCNDNMKRVFTSCLDSRDEGNSPFCFNSRSIFKNNLETEGNGLLCVVRNNLNPHVKFREEMVIRNVTDFNRILSRKKLFNYSPLKFDGAEMPEVAYRFGDVVWAFTGNKTIPFGIPKQVIDMKCGSEQNVRYLTDYDTECLHIVPDSREKCTTASRLGMHYYLRDVKLIKSPAVITPTNSSDKVCNNKTCIEITPYICPEESNLSSCVKSPPRRLIWEDNCKNVVTSVEYHIYHNGTEGVQDARAYFTLRTLQKESFLQKIKLKFLWLKQPFPVFKKSGNPGYIIGKPIISGRKVYSSNETTPQRKEAIELSYNPEDWLTVIGSKSGVCSPRNRRPIGFGENARFTCTFEPEKSDDLKKKCEVLQESLLQFMLGEDFADVKANGNLNKFVATFGNSEVENTGDWVQVMIDPLPVASGQVLHSDHVFCKSIVSDLFVDVAYSKIGSFEKPQNKILGVRFHFGTPNSLFYHVRSNRDSNFKISTYVHFIDLTIQPRPEFAETPGFEAKLPHDFFYPFFSGSCANSFSFCLIAFVFVIVRFM